MSPCGQQTLTGLEPARAAGLRARSQGLFILPQTVSYRFQLEMVLLECGGLCCRLPRPVRRTAVRIPSP